jgi:hypothetical protein
VTSSCLGETLFRGVRELARSVSAVSAGQRADWVLTGADRLSGLAAVCAGQVSDWGADWPDSIRGSSVSESGPSRGSW